MILTSDGYHNQIKSAHNKEAENGQSDELEVRDKLEELDDIEEPDALQTASI